MSIFKIIKIVVLVWEISQWVGFWQKVCRNINSSNNKNSRITSSNNKSIHKKINNSYIIVGQVLIKAHYKIVHNRDKNNQMIMKYKHNIKITVKKV
jgi:hypothetical protein